MAFVDIPCRIWIKREGKYSIEKCEDRLQAITKIALYNKFGIEAGHYYRQFKKNQLSRKKIDKFKLQGLQGGE
tara:strand:+ start:7820 stop:8038 length:219 start_codon:yes stop_codon:yes gene_type:complete